MPRSIQPLTLSLCILAFCFLIAGSAQANPEATWSFEEPSGLIAFDTSGNGHDGALLGGAQHADGISGLGLSFPASGDAVEVAPSGALGQLQQVSISVWARQAPRGNFTALVDARDNPTDGYDLFFSDTGRLFMRVNQSSIVGSTVVADDAWHHLVGVWDGLSLTLYVDGVLDASTAIPVTTVDVVAPLLLGRHFESAPQWELSGSLDEVRIYDYALDATEISTLFQGNNTDTTAPLRSNARPTGLLPSGTVEVTLEVDTNEDAECRFAEVSGTTYEAMTDTFATTGSLAHATVISGLADGETHTFYLRCADILGNVNADDVAIELTIDSAAPGEPGLIGHWPFEDCSAGDCSAEDAGAIAFDASGNGHDATLRGGATFTTGQVGPGLDLTGAGDYAEVDSSALTNQPQALTIAAWIQHASRPEFTSIVDKRDGGSDGYDLYLTNTGRPFVRVNGSTLAGTVIVTDGTWHHLAAVWDGLSLALYVDGSLDASQATTATSVDTAGPLLLGRHFQGNSQWEFAGLMDEVRVYDRALSAFEVSDLTLATGPRLNLLPNFPDKHVIQRIGTTADLPLGGSYVGFPSAIEGRLVDAATGAPLTDFDWAVVDPAPTGGQWSGSLTAVPQGGWYRLELRFSNDPRVALTPSGRLGVGMVVAALGQSSMAKLFTEIAFAGDGDLGVASQDTPDELTHRYGYGDPRGSATDLGGYLRPASNPGTPHYGDVTGAGGVRFANQLADALNLPILVIDLAIDGTSLLEWTDPQWIGRLNLDAALITVGGDIEALVWFQGGEDILNDLAPTTYLNRLNLFYDQVQAQLPATRTLEFFEAIQGRGDYPQPHDASYAAIRQVQLEWPQQRTNVHPAGTGIDLHLAASSFNRGDGHFTASQYQIMADRYTRAILKVLGQPGYTDGVGGPQVAGAVLSGTQITVSFAHDQGTALTMPNPGADIEGFELSADGFATVLRLGQGIQSAQLSSNGQDVVLELGTEPVGTLGLRYLYGMNPFGHKSGAANRRANGNTIFDDFQYHPERTGLPVHPTTSTLIVTGGQ